MGDADSHRWVALQDKRLILKKDFLKELPEEILSVASPQFLKYAMKCFFFLSSLLGFLTVDLDTWYLIQGWHSLCHQNRKPLAQNTPFDYNIFRTDLVQ